MNIKFDPEERQKLSEFNEKYPDGVALVRDDFFQELITRTLERGYFETVLGNSHVNFPPSMKAYPMGWARISRLPVHPSESKKYDLLARWQSTLSVVHMLGYRLVFVLKRFNGQTNIYVGVYDNDGIIDNESAVNTVIQSATIHMAGIGIEKMNHDTVNREICLPVQTLPYCGIVTGIPSQRKSEEYSLLQTLDKLAFGIRDYNGILDRNYSLVVIANPVRDMDISGLIGSMLNLQSEIHDKINISITEGVSESTSKFQNTSKAINLGGILIGLFNAAAVVATGSIAAVGVPALLTAIKAANIADMLKIIGMDFGGNISKSKGASHGFTKSKSVTKQYLNSVAQYCEQNIQKHVKRLERGRNLGFWNTGIYILADNITTADSVLGILRSIYSGEETYVEPIRAFSLNNNPMASEYIRNFDYIPIPVNPEVAKASAEQIDSKSGWHIFGPLFEAFTTPLNTEELSIATSLPRRDVPGLKFVKNAVKFAANPPTYPSDALVANIGNVVDTGVSLDVDYQLDLNTLTRHCLLTGLTGTGKTTTAKKLLAEVDKHNIPFMVIEPAKTEYVDWALEYNRKVIEHNSICFPDECKTLIDIYMPGVNSYADAPLKQLRLNPFQPAAIKTGSLNMLNRLEKFQSILMASLPMADVLPLITEEALYEFTYAKIGTNAWQNDVPFRDIIAFPMIKDLLAVAERIISAKGYEEKVRDNLKAAVNTRIKSLLRGWKNDVLNATQSTDSEELFDRKVVVNLSRLSGNSDKAFLMSLLMLSLSEYRESRYYYDLSYRKDMKDRNVLRHLAVIEEAHRILMKVHADAAGIGNPHAVISNMFCDMLAEIRAYGQGFVIVDQVPAKLIPDAIKNTSLKIVHRLVAADDRETMGLCMGLRQEQQDIITVLEPGNVILCSDQDDAAMWVKIQKVIE